MGGGDVSKCPECRAQVDLTLSVACNTCNRNLHYSCIGVRAVDASLIADLCKKSAFIKISCSACANSPSLNVSQICSDILENSKFKEGVNHILEGVISAVNSLKTQVDDLKSSNIELVKVCSKMMETPLSNKTDRYSDKVKNLNNNRVIVKPKNSLQTQHGTKSDLFKNIDPITCGLKIDDVRTASGNGIIISADSINCDKFEQVFSEKLSGNYTASKLSPLHPKIRIVGFSKEITEQDFIEVIMSQNKDIFDYSFCRLIKYWPTYKNKDIYQAILQVDVNTYEQLLQRKNILIGYSSCFVFDAVELMRCYKCNGFNHTSTRCTKNLSCPLCAHEHNVKECPNVDQPRNCSNCARLKVQNPQIKTNHASWEYESCHAYKTALSIFKQKILNVNQVINK